MREDFQSYFEYFKFFRFRSRYLNETRNDGAGWLFESIHFIDFTKDIFFEESLVISQISYGGYGYKILSDMPFDEYAKIVKLCKPIADEMSEGIKGNDESGN